MEDPVITEDGESYDRKHLQLWLAQGHRYHPHTGADLSKFLPNRALKAMIDEYRARENPLTSSEIQLHEVKLDFAANEFLQLLNKEAEEKQKLEVLRTVLQEIDDKIASVQQELQVASDPDTFCDSGLILFHAGHFSEALAQFDHALTLAPNNSQVHRYRGLVFFQLHRYEEAKKSYLSSLLIHPLCVATLNDFAVLLNKMGEHMPALFYLQQAISLASENSDLYNNKGVVLLALGRTREALLSNKKAIDCNPANAPAWRNRGDLLQAVGELHQAINCYAESLRLRANHPGTSKAHKDALNKFKKAYIT